MFNKRLHNKIGSLEWDIKCLQDAIISLDKNVNCLKENHSWKVSISPTTLDPYIFFEVCYCLPPNDKPKAKG